MDELITYDDNIVLRTHSATHIDNGDGTFTAICSSGMNYLSNGSWKDSQYYFLEQIGEHAWSNMCDDFPVSLDNGLVTTKDHEWKIEGIYIGENKIWEPDFTVYSKYGFIVDYEMPFGILRYTIRPEMYKEEIILNVNPFAGQLIDGDELIIKYIGETDDNVWAKDASGKQYSVNKTRHQKSMSKDNFYRAKYPLIIDPSLNVSIVGDAFSDTADSLVHGSEDYLDIGLYVYLDDKAGYMTANTRAAILFDLTSLVGATVTGASLTLVITHKGQQIANHNIFSSPNITNPELLNYSQFINLVKSNFLATIPHQTGQLSPITLGDSTYLTSLTAKCGSYETLILEGNNIYGQNNNFISPSSSEHVLEWYRPVLAITYTSGAPVGTKTKINVGDVWKDASGLKINVNDSWKPVAGMKVNVGDSWKTVF